VLPRLMGANAGIDGSLAQRTNVDQGRSSGHVLGGDDQAGRLRSETISMLSTALERAVAGLPREQRTDERKARLASGILAAAARGERDPIRLYAIALGVGPWEPSIGGTPPTSQPVWHRP
jgi:hypothetical protein